MFHNPAPCYTPTVHRRSGFSTFLPTLFSGVYCTVTILTMWGGVLVVWICISVVISGLEHLLMCLLASCVSYLERYLFKYCSHFFSQYVFLLLSLHEFPAYSKYQLLTGMWVEDIFPHCEDCLFTVVSLIHVSVNLMEPISLFPAVGWPFGLLAEMTDKSKVMNLCFYPQLLVLFTFYV